LGTELFSYDILVGSALEAVWGREVGSGSLTEIVTKDAQLSRRRRLLTALLSFAVCRGSAVLSPLQGQRSVLYYIQLSISVLTVFINNFGGQFYVTPPSLPVEGSSARRYNPHIRASLNFIPIYLYSYCATSPINA